MTDYEKYQLDWLKDHGISIRELINEIAECEKEGAENATEAFDIIENESGLAGGQMWSCEDEWAECDKGE